MLAPPSKSADPMLSTHTHGCVELNPSICVIRHSTFSVVSPAQPRVLHQRHARMDRVERGARGCDGVMAWFICWFCTS